MKKEEEVDRRKGGKTISMSGQGWTLSAQLRQVKTEQDRKIAIRRDGKSPDRRQHGPE